MQEKERKRGIEGWDKKDNIRRVKERWNKGNWRKEVINRSGYAC